MDAAPLPLPVIVILGLFGLALAGGLGSLIVVTALDVLASPKRLLVRLAARSITSHKVKSLIVGGLLAGGTFLLVVGVTFIINTGRQMEQTITGGLVGHLQIYSHDAKDDLAFFGFAASGSQDLSVIQDFGKVKRELLKVPNVKAVIPMGRDVAQAIGGNEFDERLGELRDAVRDHDTVRAGKLESRLRHMIDLLKTDVENRGEISRNQEEIAAQRDDVTKALSPEFWAAFQANPLPALDFLDTHIAPLQADDGQFFLPYIGTDLDAFAREFPRFEIDKDDGSTMIPSGHRGFLFNRTFYEEMGKNQVAHELDEIRRTIHDDRTTIASNVDLQERIKKNIKQYRRITYQLTPEDADALARELRAFMPGVQGQLEDLLKAFLEVDDSNIEQRWQFFYDHIAPRIRLYKVKVGDTITLRAFTKSGYMRSINLPVFGTFRFRGIDGSPVASRYNFMDIMSFRDLYGLMTPARKRELEAIRAEVGVKDVNRDDAEAQLFGGGASSTAEVRQATEFADPSRDETVHSREQAAAAGAHAFTQSDIDNGVVLNAAIVLNDPSRLRQSMAAIQKLNKDENLNLNIIDWTTASGIVGQLTGVLSGALLVIIGIIFIVALVIINNSMVMATMDRMVEIGMMRAIGAQRRFVRALYMLETTALAALAVVVGSVAGAIAVAIFRRVGIRASADLLVIMFGGRWLYPTIEPRSFVVALVIIAIVSLVATFYPALIATRIAPIVAMQRRE